MYFQNCVSLPRAMNQTVPACGGESIRVQIAGLDCQDNVGGGHKRATEVPLSKALNPQLLQWRPAQQTVVVLGRFRCECA